MEHLKEIGEYNGTLGNLAEDIGDLRYDALAEFIGLLSVKIYKDALKDKLRKRSQLSGALFEISSQLEDAQEIIKDAWKICKPCMDK